MKPFAFVIEDTEDLSIVFRRALEVAQYDVEVIEDGGVAMERLAQVAPHLVVLDLHLPTVPGDVILDYIRSQARLKEVQVIVATADSAFAEALMEDATLTLLKPVSFSQLKEMALRLAPAQAA